ncbi:MAG TPA: metal ABC transporter substrate-binding protein [Dehalococcoidia bacterium]|nr:metal ABC transporter substrate-binding protein [Dehalococcoidia bacterium]
MAFSMMWACGGEGSEEESPSPEASLTATPFQLPERSPTEMELPVRIAVTLPIFEGFAREAGGENVEVISLIPAGSDPHSYEFTPQDLEKMKGIDFFFLNGLGLDSRLQDVIEANRDEDAYVIPFAPNILSPSGGGLTAAEAHDDAHLWLDPALAYVYTEIVADELDIYDGIRKETYDANFTAFRDAMLSLQNDIFSRLQALSADRRKLVTFHDSFDHFARKFELEVAGYAVAKAGDAPTPDAVGRLVQIVGEQAIPAVFAEYGYDAGLMQQVATQAGVQLCTLYSDIVDPALTYDEMMNANADEILRCLGS